MRKQVRFGIATAFCAVASLVAHADTVAWWRFEEKAPGEKAAVGTVKDSVNEIVAIPEVSEGTTVYEAGTPKYESSAYAPVYASPFAGRKVVDPVSGATCINNAAMKFSTAKGGSGNLPAYYGGCLKVANTKTLLGNRSSKITIEAFICTTGGENCANNFAPVIASVDGTGWTGERWALYLDTESSGLGRFAMRINTGTGFVRYQSNAPATKINDGAWHHIAYVYDGTAYDGTAQKPSVKLYIDYVCVATYTDTLITSFIPYGENNAIYIGGYDKYINNNNPGYRRFPGLIDEVRISSEALAPAQFLQMHPADEIDGELLRLSFDPGEYGTLFNDRNMSDTLAPSNDYQRALLKTGQSGGEVLGAYDRADKAGGAVAAGMFRDAEENVSSFHFSTNAAAKGYYIQASSFSPRLTGGASTNYTVECFFKTSGQVRGPTSNRQTIFRCGSDKVFANAVLCAETAPKSMTTGDMLFSCRNSTGGTEYISTVDMGGVVADDGEWHHLAYVVDGDRKEWRVYFDYRLVARKSSFSPGVTGSYSLFVGSGYNNAGGTQAQYFDGWIDDLRVTKRAIGVDEFLATRPVGKGAEAAPLLTALLEQNYNFDCASNSYWSVTGVGAARPVFQNVSRGTLLLDGANGSERAANDWSAKMDRSNITFPVSPLYEQDAYTVEFWAKFDGYKNGADEVSDDYKFGGNNHVGVLRFVRADSTTFDWYLFRIADNPSGFQIAIRNAKGTIEYKSFLLENRLVADGKWHHYAVQIARNADNTQCSVMLYADYEPLADKNAEPVPQTVAGIFKSATGHRLMVCESTSADYNILGNIDAVRFWRGTPDPSQFLCRAPNGLMLIVR